MGMVCEYVWCDGAGLWMFAISDWLGFFNESEKNRLIDRHCRVTPQQITGI